MGVRYDRELMTRGEAARRLIADGEDPWVMLLAAVSPDRDWSESVLHAELAPCPRCSNDRSDCPECGNTRLVTAARRKLSVFERVGPRTRDHRLAGCAGFPLTMHLGQCKDSCAP